MSSRPRYDASMRSRRRRRVRFWKPSPRPSGEAATRNRRLSVTTNRRDHLEHLTRLAYLVHAEDACTEPCTDGRRRQRAHQPLVKGNVERFPDKVLVGQRNEDRPPREHQLVEMPCHLE